MIKTKRDEDQYLYFLCDIFSLWASNSMLVERFYKKPDYHLLEKQLFAMFEK